MADDPAQFFNNSWYQMQHMEADRLAALQLSAVQWRFASLRDRIPVLTTIADDLPMVTVDRIADVVPLMFPHAVYKSYPPSLLESGNFAALTRWLDRLTTVDLSTVDVSGCDTIDSWLDTLDAVTELRLCHSSGTSGAMSFLPRSVNEWERMYRAIRCGLFQFSDPLGEEDHDGEYFTLIWPLYRYGRSAIGRLPEMALPDIIGSEDRLQVMREGRLSSDSMYLAGRLHAAAARGELHKLEINPALKARRAELEQEQHELREGLGRFMDETIERFRGQRVWIMGIWNVLDEMSRAGLARGIEQVFAPDSVITTGGGTKGQVVPDDWEQTATRFLGVEHLQHAYAMSELTAMNKICDHGRYHVEPWIVPFVLDPDDGRMLPREGRQTGRAAFFDLLPESYWGGFVTGDEITADWTPCPCGRTTTHIERSIERFSEKRGGDDKITCAAAEDAHRSALEFLTERLA